MFFTISKFSFSKASTPAKLLQIVFKALGPQKSGLAHLPKGPLKSSEPGRKKCYKAGDCCGPTGFQAGAHWHFHGGPPCRAVSWRPSSAQTWLSGKAL